MNKVQLIFCLILASSAAIGQSKNEGFITESEGINHLLTHSDAAYPPIARAAHVQGTVILHVSVDTKGNVTDVSRARP
jgi:outer membrane biosynthesis protein TonB